MNPYAAEVPEFLPRYRHGSHPHRLLVQVGVPNARFCDGCNHDITKNDVRFVCLICDFDLCVHCFRRRPEVEVPLSLYDDDNNVRILPRDPPPPLRRLQRPDQHAESHARQGPPRFAEGMR